MKISQVGDKQALGARIRQFFEQLFTSRYVKFLEAEVIRLRTANDTLLGELRRVQLGAYVQPPSPSTLWSSSTTATSFPEPLGKYEQELALHMKAIESEPAKES